jgi:hypothetical protein
MSIAAPAVPSAGDGSAVAATAAAAAPQSQAESRMSDIPDEDMAGALQRYEAGCLQTTPDPPESSNESKGPHETAAAAGATAPTSPAKERSAPEQQPTAPKDQANVAPDGAGAGSVPPPPPPAAPASPPPPAARGSSAPASGPKRRPNTPDYSSYTGVEALTAARRCNPSDAALLRGVCRAKGKDWIDEQRTADSWTIVHLVAASKDDAAAPLLQFLYKQGVTMNAVTAKPGGLRPMLPQSSSALHFAVAFNAKECGRFLLSLGDLSFLNYRNQAEQTALDMNAVAERRSANDRKEWDDMFAACLARLEASKEKPAVGKQSDDMSEDKEEEEEEEVDEEEEEVEDVAAQNAEQHERRSTTSTDSGIATTVETKSGCSSSSSSSSSTSGSFPSWAMADYCQKVAAYLIPQTSVVATPSELFTDTPSYSVSRPFAFCLLLPVGQEDMQLQTSLSSTERMRPPLPCFTFSVLQDGNCWVMSLLLADAAPRNPAIAALAERWCQLRMSPIKGGVVHKEDVEKEKEIIKEYRNL